MLARTVASLARVRAGLGGPLPSVVADIGRDVEFDRHVSEKLNDKVDLTVVVFLEPMRFDERVEADHIDISALDSFADHCL